MLSIIYYFRGCFIVQTGDALEEKLRAQEETISRLKDDVQAGERRRRTRRGRVGQRAPSVGHVARRTHQQDAGPRAGEQCNTYTQAKRRLLHCDSEQSSCIRTNQSCTDPENTNRGKRCRTCRHATHCIGRAAPGYKVVWTLRSLRE